MHQLPHAKKQLVPLRRFAVDGLYSIAYISQLVQKGKLKAEKKGRNYRTTREWFEEYLNEHAVDEIRVQYKELFRELDLRESAYNKRVKEGIQVIAETPQANLISRFSRTAVVSVAAVFVLLIIATVIGIMNFNNDGQVAGEEEVRIKETATTTTPVIPETKGYPESWDKSDVHEMPGS